jgi:hypothetical protein
VIAKTMPAEAPAPERLHDAASAVAGGKNLMGLRSMAGAILSLCFCA